MLYVETCNPASTDLMMNSDHKLKTMSTVNRGFIQIYDDDDDNDNDKVSLI